MAMGPEGRPNEQGAPDGFLSAQLGDTSWSAIKQDRILTVPNLLSFLRLAGVPVFLWLLLVPHADVAALLILVLSGITDWLDGKLARWLDQSSRLGAMLDPAVDRLYIAATLVAFAIRDIVPLWLVLVLFAREIVLGLALLVLRHHGFGPYEVHYLGKAATFCLLYAFPLLLLAQGTSTVSLIAQPVAYAFTVWGCVLYLWSGALYVWQGARAVLGSGAAAGTRPETSGVSSK
ncbi:CDP-alcohol phosphatidyltransferase family protein [Actinoalloteichus spitiensis]|uniref:CDP-alcohol phosphatidyltransferase family protein n=1 Tax=Actinoalloteichus spitiensis TaxID=252394 RepID=UPI00037A2BCD